MPQDVFKILKDLEYKAAGVDPKTQKIQEGHFVSFRNIGLPIREEDYRNPWTPAGAEMKKIISDAKAASTPPGAGATPDGTGVVTPPGDIAALQAAGIGESIMNFASTFYLTDDKLSLSNNYDPQNTAGKVHEAYYAIINGAHAIPPKTQVNDSIRKALEESQAKLVDKDGFPTPLYSAYNTYHDAYYDKVKSLNRNYGDAMSDPVALHQWPIVGKVYQDDVNKAWNEWISFGHKLEVETAMNLLAAQGQDPAVLLINRAKQKWENSLVHLDKIDDVPYTFMSPRNWYSADADGWMTYSQQDFHSEVHISNSSSSFGASAGFSVGFWSAGASVSGSHSDQLSQMKTSGLEVTFSYAVADIIRPWLDTNLLNLSNWFLVGDYKKNTISDGTFGQQFKSTTNLSTFLPSVVTSVILVKDLKIKWNEMSTNSHTVDDTIKGGGSVGFGPFRVGGSYEHSSHKYDFSHNYVGGYLQVKGVQLLGYISSILPASPRLDSAPYMQNVNANGKPKTAVKIAVAQPQ